MDTLAMVFYLIVVRVGGLAQIPGGDPGRGFQCRIRNTRPPVTKCAGIGLPKKAALYTMNFPSEQRLTHAGITCREH
jgi:hypothetical protein